MCPASPEDMKLGLGMYVLKRERLITTVDTPYYDGVFRFEDATRFAGCKMTEFYLFDPSVFRGYSHINTLDDESAIKDHKCFGTRVFKKEE